MGRSQRLAINNPQSDALSVIIEPWAEEVVLHPRSILEIVIQYTYDGYPYVVPHDEFIEVYLWSGCTCRLLIDDVEIDNPGLDVPPP